MKDQYATSREGPEASESLLDHWAREWAELKRQEERLAEKRLEVERMMDQFLSFVPQDSSKTMHLLNGTKLKITRKMNYKVDLVLLEMLTAEWPEDIRPIKHKAVVDEAMLKQIRKESPNAWAKIARSIETKPAKVNFSIDRGEN